PARTGGLLGLGVRGGGDLLATLLRRRDRERRGKDPLVWRPVRRQFPVRGSGQFAGHVPEPRAGEALRADLRPRYGPADVCHRPARPAVPAAAGRRLLLADLRGQWPPPVAAVG